MGRSHLEAPRSGDRRLRSSRRRAAGLGFRAEPGSRGSKAVLPVSRERSEAKAPKASFSLALGSILA
jgi:hypothetical protein